MKAIEDAGSKQRPAVMMVQLAPLRPQGGNLGDYIRSVGVERRHVNHNRFQLLTMEQVDFWEDVARAFAPESAGLSAPAIADFPPLPLLKPRARRHGGSCVR